MNKNVIATCCLCNNASVNIYETNGGYVLAGINDEKPTYCEVLFDRMNEEEGELEAVIPYFKLGELEIGLNECIRVGGN